MRVLTYSVLAAGLIGGAMVVSGVAPASAAALPSSLAPTAHVDTGVQKVTHDPLARPGRHYGPSYWQPRTYPRYGYTRGYYRSGPAVSFGLSVPGFSFGIGVPQYRYYGYGRPYYGRGYNHGWYGY
jgi:hypothetical protein